MDTSLPNYRSLDSLGNWDSFIADRYPNKTVPSSDRCEPDSVREFYRLNHVYQTYDFVRGKKDNFLASRRRRLSVWEAIALLDRLTDDADPEVNSQQQHLLRTAEAIRADGHPDWLVLVGLIHDLGKILCLFGEPQWAVVGNIFPVGCRYADEVVHSEFFRFNPDYWNATYQTPLGVYNQGEGLARVHFSWGHSEYLYHIVKDYLPEPALYTIRYHSFFAAHRNGAYSYLMNEHDHEMFRWVKLFSPYDDDAKGPLLVNVEQVRPYYEWLVAKYLPEKLLF